ncbi:MAG: hypothetical protein A2073_06945 [Deltaproteobacteria bacterium GWC2_42_11]|nr:MAG: hypothetical protein A2073_06945 [Deltaproteobacteria bacterium GWC2_42_11]HBO83560.1 hypothetical protein [Deltaproteobacteria bacterium]
MIEEQGIVVGVKEKEKSALIRAERGSACEKCQAKDFCYSIGGKEMLVETDNPVNAGIGDRVVFKIPASAILKVSMILYLVPLFAFILGVITGQEFGKNISPEFNPDLMSGVFGALFLAAAFFGIRIYGKSAEKRQGLRPTVTRVINAV